MGVAWRAPLSDRRAGRDRRAADTAGVGQPTVTRDTARGVVAKRRPKPPAQRDTRRGFDGRPGTPPATGDAS